MQAQCQVCAALKSLINSAETAVENAAVAARNTCPSASLAGSFRLGLGGGLFSDETLL
jgi:hypothetical protein